MADSDDVKQKMRSSLERVQRYNSSFNLLSSHGAEGASQGLSNLDLNRNYHEEAKKIAIGIFNEYLKINARNGIDMDAGLRCQIYKKFGCRFQNHDSSQSTPSASTHTRSRRGTKQKTSKSIQADDSSKTTDSNKNEVAGDPDVDFLLYDTEHINQDELNRHINQDLFSVVQQNCL